MNYIYYYKLETFCGPCGVRFYEMNMKIKLNRRSHKESYPVFSEHRQHP